MTKPFDTNYNILTGETTITEYTKEQIADLEKKQKQYAIEAAKAQAEIAAKAAARQAILDRLGLTADEAKLLLG